MTTALSDQGIQFAGGNVVDVRASYPTTGTYTAGDIVLESSTAARVSGWKRQTTGSNNVLNTDWIYFTSLNLSTSVATTSGTSIDYTGIPSWVKRITVLLNGVSTNGTSIVQVQIGSGFILATGYVSSYQQGATGYSSTTGFALPGISTGDARRGAMVITLVGSNIWVETILADTNGASSGSGGGSVALSGTLDRLRLTTVNGTDTFDAGSVNIMYEG